MSSYSILIVDDEPDNFDVIEALLPSETYQLHYANCGEDAIASLDKFDPDLILLDVMMPGIDGIEVCKRIKLMSKWHNVPIIMVTALSGKEDLARCLAAGATDFINKPVNGLELRARVNAMLRIKKQYDRIQSLSRLQRNNIQSLANNLNEIRLDLAVGFPNEFNSPLSSISDNIDYLKQNIERLSLPETMGMLDSSERAVTRLHTLTQKFWLYLKLIVDTPTPDPEDLSLPRSIVEQILFTRLAGTSVTSDLVCEIQDVRLAVNVDLAEWIFSELIDYVFDTYPANTHLKISGETIDNTFHLSLSSTQEKTSEASNSDAEITKLIQFTSPTDETKELAIGLKIAKKIVEIYDGLFLMSDIDQGEISVYLTLPLVSDRLPKAELQSQSATMPGQSLD
jgi:two-component system, sensor histidine kinase and response regulator